MSFESLEDIYLSRCRLTSKGYVPTFWQVGEIEKEPFTLFGDSRRTVDESWGISNAIEKILALNLHLELPVGEFVTSATKRELPKNPYVIQLLKSNIADEARHFQGFKKACDSYQPRPEYLSVAEKVAESWTKLSEKEHPLYAPLILEVGLFLLSLGFLRSFGGRSLATLAAKVAEDEYRHTVTNRSVVASLGYDAFSFSPEFISELEGLIEWIFEGVKVPRQIIGTRWDKDYFLSVSRDLLATGRCPKFNDAIAMADYEPPFERRNKDMYSRVFA